MCAFAHFTLVLYWTPLRPKELAYLSGIDAIPGMKGKINLWYSRGTLWDGHWLLSGGKRRGRGKFTFRTNRCKATLLGNHFFFYRIDTSPRSARSDMGRLRRSRAHHARRDVHRASRTRVRLSFSRYLLMAIPHTHSYWYRYGRRTWIKFS